MYSVGHISIGLFWTLFFGHFGTSIIVNEQWNYIQKQENSKRPYKYTAIFVGLVERALYFFAILSGYEEFVAVWLALKVAGRWGRWETDKKEKGEAGRAYYNIFLVGSGLSLGFAYTGVNLVNLLHTKEYSIAWIAPAALLIGLTIIWGFIFILQEEDKIKRENSPIAKSKIRVPTPKKKSCKKSTRKE